MSKIGSKANKNIKRPTILVSNDDGISAPGLLALVKELKNIGSVVVVAPDKQQSAVGHAITMNYPLRATKYIVNGKFLGYAVEGTPADCVKLAVGTLIKSPIDILVSGINHGANTAISVIYSGTVSAATEGTILGIPSIAVSLTSYDKTDFRFAAKFARKLTDFILKKGLPNDTLLNVNIPAVNEKDIKGVIITRQGKSRWNDTFDLRRDPYNKEYYWLTGKLNIIDKANDADLIAIKNNYISITPIHFDLTNYKFLKVMRGWQLMKLL